MGKALYKLFYGLIITGSGIVALVYGLSLTHTSMITLAPVCSAI